MYPVKAAAVSTFGRFDKLWFFSGGLVIRAHVFGVHIRAVRALIFGSSIELTQNFSSCWEYTKGLN